MKIWVIRTTAIFLFLLCASLCFAQGKRKGPANRVSRSNFTGTWVLDKTRTDMSGYERDLRESGITLILEHREPEIKITRIFRSGGKDRRQELIYYTDGRGEKNPLLDGKTQFSSHTKWDGERLLTKVTFRSPLPRGGIVDRELITRWELSTDGATLTQTSSFKTSRVWRIGQDSSSNSPAGQELLPPTSKVDKRVFNRVP